MGIIPNTLYQGDCIEQMGALPAQSIDLAFADPPFNIGFEYDQYDDSRSCDEYLNWSHNWMAAVKRLLKPGGTFWLAIGDEYAAELKVIAKQDLNLCCRSWVIWYYTFGVNCVRGFSRSHTHLFHFVNDAENFTFNAENPLVRVLSARQLVYKDSRANPKGRLPDNTWILRPPDASPDSFAPMHDMWYFARVAGTFKEREGFHGCQMPEQLLGRIIRVSSNPGDIVFDPFAGSGTSLVTAKKLGRRWIGCELSPDYAQRAEERIAAANIGDPLDGPEDPMRSAPSTAKGKSKLRIRNGRPVPFSDDSTEQAIIEAFAETSDGNSTDFFICDKELNKRFVAKCKQAKIPGNAFTWNHVLLKIRKSGKLPKSTRSRQQLLFEEMDGYSFGAEIAMQLLSLDYGMGIDDILCNPSTANDFDRLAALYAPGSSSFDYRWSALTIRKRAKTSKTLAVEQFAEWAGKRLPKSVPLSECADDRFKRVGVYVVSGAGQPLYVGETLCLRDRVDQILQSESWRNLNADSISVIPQHNAKQQHGLQSMLIHRLRPLLNSQLLMPTIPS